MLTLSKPYSKKIGSMFGIKHCDVLAPNVEELKAFWEETRTIVDKPQFHQRYADTLTMDFKETQREQLTGLIYRFNCFLIGEKLQVDKQTYLREFGADAVKAVIYATDYCPEGMTIDEYANAILSAFDNFGDSHEFDKRVINIAIVDKVQYQLETVSLQVRLFKTLLSSPLEEPVAD